MSKTKTMPKKKAEERKLLRVSQVAYRLNVSEPTIYRWCDHGLLEKVKFTDRTIRITETSLELFLQKGLKDGQD